MRKPLRYVLLCLILAALAYFLWPMQNERSVYKIDGLLPLEYTPLNPRLSSFDGYLSRQKALAFEKLLRPLSKEELAIDAQAGYALSALSSYFQSNRSTKVKKRIAKLSASLMSSEREQRLLIAPGKQMEHSLTQLRSAKADLMGLLRRYEHTGSNSALKDCLNRAASFDTLPGYVEDDSKIARMFLEPYTLMYFYTGAETLYRYCNAYYRQGNIDELPSLPEEDNLYQESACTILSYLNGSLLLSRTHDKPALLPQCRKVWEQIKHQRKYLNCTDEWFRFNKLLFTHSGGVKYLDEIETMLYNNLVPSPVLFDRDTFICALPKEQIALVLEEAQELYAGTLREKLVINLYEKGSGTVDLSINGKEQRINYTLDTEYPRNGTVDLTLFPEDNRHFSIALRVPSWCKDFVAYVEHKAHRGQAGTYLEISRTWSPGDIIRICMTMNVEQRKRLGRSVFARGPQMLRSVDGSVDLTSAKGQRMKQIYRLHALQPANNARLLLSPIASSPQSPGIELISAEAYQLVEELPSDRLTVLRKQLAAFREEFGGANDMPDVKFFLFGMGNRKKIIYRDGQLIDAANSHLLVDWQISHQTIVPNAYQVILRSIAGDSIIIYEDEKGVFIKTGDQEAPSLIPGTDSPVKLPAFAQHPYSEILKVLHHEILINIVDSHPVPNFLVYPKPWRRDAAMMAMCLDKTDNLNLIRQWALQLNAPYDYNNKLDGVPEEEPDNLGQTLYLLSLFSNKEHPLVPKILNEASKYEKNWFGKKYIKGRTDFGYYPVYQTKWMKFGLKKMGMDDPYQIPHQEDNYNALFWWDYKEADEEIADYEVWRLYPYISWAKDHYFGEKKSPISNRDYPLTWEIEASQADYEGMGIIDTTYVLEQNASPHTWHAAEIFLYLLDDSM